MSEELKRLTPEREAEYLNAMQSNIQSLQISYQAMKDDHDYNCLKALVETHYTMGQVVKLTILSGGFTNRNYAVEFDNGSQAFLRQYVAEKEEKEILYEHGLLQHVRNNGFTLGALPYQTKDGVYYFQGFIGGENRYFSLSEFLPGENTYNWEYNEVTDEACASAAETTAHLHLASSGFNPPPTWGGNEPIMREQLSYYGSNMRKYTEMIKQNPDNQLFVQYLESKLDYLDDVISRLVKIYDEDDKLTKSVIHTDLHPGNFKYENEKTVAIFDFDWPKTDVRLYETAISAMFFSCSWRSEKNGQLDLRLMKLWMDSYDGVLEQKKGALAPMNDTERKYFPEMMMIGSLYPIHYGITKCALEEGTNIFEWFYYTIHQLNCIEWIDSHMDEIRAICVRRERGL